MARYCDGDIDAFRALYDVAARVILRDLLSLVGDRASAEALLRQTFSRIHRSRRAYIRGADPMPWFSSIARGVVRDHLRLAGRGHATSAA